jgi:hypothetical protein
LSSHFADVQGLNARLEFNQCRIGDVVTRLNATGLGLRITPSHGSVSNCFMPRLMRWVSGLIFTIWTFTVSPTLSTWLGCETRFQLMSVTCSRPSMPPRSTNAP